MTTDPALLFPTLTEAAYRQIVFIRDEHLRYFPNDPPETLAIVRGTWISKVDGSRHAQVAAGFYRRSEMNDHLRRNRRYLRGFPCVIPGDPEAKASFAGKTLDYSPERAFFVREEVAEGG
jgi:hypothetical protein